MATVQVVEGYTDVWVIVSNMQYWEKGYDYFEITGTNGISHTWSGGGQSYSTSTTLAGLQQGTTYTIYVWGHHNGGTDYFGSVTFTTLIPVPAVPSAPLIDTSYGDGGRFEGGLLLKWGASSGATRYRIKARRGYDSYTTYFENTSNSLLVAPLDFGTTYFFSVSAGNNAGWSAYSTENQGTTAPQTPIISASNVTNSSIRINLSTITGDWTKVEVYRRNPQGTLLGTAIINKSGQQYVDYNITADTKFTARAFLTINNVDIRSMNISNEISFQAAVKPTAWAWSTGETNAFNNKGAVATLTYSKWNDFIDKIIAFRNYKGVPINVVVGGVSYPILNAKMTSGDKVLSALRFNIAKTAIHEMYGTGITDKSKGNTVYGSYFTTLSNSLNSIS